MHIKRQIHKAKNNLTRVSHLALMAIYNLKKSGILLNKAEHLRRHSKSVSELLNAKFLAGQAKELYDKDLQILKDSQMALSAARTNLDKLIEQEKQKHDTR